MFVCSTEEPMYLIANGSLITRVPGDEFFMKDGGVVVVGSRIAEVGTTAELVSKYPRAEFIDACGGIIMPGFIDAHTRFYSSLTCGFDLPVSERAEYYEFLHNGRWSIDRHLTLDLVKMSAYASIAERIKNGVTTVFDSHASYFEPTGSLGSIASAVRDCGIRACLCYETSDRDGNEKSELAISENLNFYDSISAMNIPTIHAMFGLHSSFTLSDATLRKCVVRNKGRTGFHISVSESPDDLYDSTQKYGCRPVQRLQNAGVLTPDSLLAHCTYVDDVGLDIIRRSGSSIVNCPESDLFNSTGCCPVFKILEKGITLGIGSDSYAADMLEVAKMSLSELRHTAGLPNAGFPEVARILFDGNAKIASHTFGIPIGRIQKGAAADIIIMDYIPYTPLSAVNTDRHIIFGMSGHECVMTMAAGRVLMRNRRLTFAREDILSRKTTAAAEDLWQAVNQDAQNRLLHDE